MNRQIRDYQVGLEAMHKIASWRPAARTEFDQVYMKESDLLVQCMFMAPLLSNKEVLFIGDGDSMSTSFLYLASLGICPSPAKCIVVDFDQRIIQSRKGFSVEYNFSDDLITYHYNVVNPLPKELVGNSDFFYINPPYSSANNGNSIIAFLTRAIEGCKEKNEGCIVIPYTENYPWSISVLERVQLFLEQWGYEIVCLLPDMHGYYLHKNQDLRSATILVQRQKAVKQPAYLGKKLPKEMLESFYGRSQHLDFDTVV